MKPCHLFFDEFEKAPDGMHNRTVDVPLLMENDGDALTSLTLFTCDTLSLFGYLFVKQNS